jgi:hypothetical protein
MHFCTAYVRIADDKDQVVYRDEFNPVSWPEVELLRSIHGDDAVHTVIPFVRIDQNPREERARLVLRYGKPYVDECFPGRGGSIVTEAPEATIAYGRVWKNPLTQLQEVIEDDGPAMEPEPANGRKRDAKGAFIKAAEL